MKRLYLLSILLMVFASCTKYEEHPFRPVSFEIGDKFYYSAKDTQVEGNLLGDHPSPELMTVYQYGDSLDISYSRNTDFLNYDMKGLGLNIMKAVGKFADGARIEFGSPEGVEGYEVFLSVPYIVLTPIRSGSSSDEDIYVATEGWIEFEKIDAVSGSVSGKFEFKAVLSGSQDCSHASEIEVRNGTFRNIPFVVQYK